MNLALLGLLSFLFQLLHDMCLCRLMLFLSSSSWDINFIKNLVFFFVVEMVFASPGFYYKLLICSVLILTLLHSLQQICSAAKRGRDVMGKGPKAFESYIRACKDHHGSYIFRLLQSLFSDPQEMVSTFSYHILQMERTGHWEVGHGIYMVYCNYLQCLR